MSLLKAGHTHPLMAAVARQIQRVAIYSRQGFDHWLPVAAIAEQTVQQYQRQFLAVRVRGHE